MSRADFQCGTIYQMYLRMLTPEGTIRSALPLLPSIAELGVEYIYLCPLVEADGDTDRSFWSDRQVRSGSDNPRNNYRLRDYFKIDPEYGTDDDVRALVKECHRLGMKVMFDLVYLHCGPTAELTKLSPDTVKRNPDGSVLRGTWPFLQNNFESRTLREHLWQNMEYFVREFDIDGYRCDVGAAVPIDFWNEGRRRIDALKPGLLMLTESEGHEKEYGTAFELAYGFSFFYGIMKMVTEKITVAEFKESLDRHHREGGLGRYIRGFHNHDIDSDEPMPRIFNDDANDAGIVLCYMVDGVPFLYNGQEVCDHNKHQMFYTAGRGYGVDWSGALTVRGQKRRELLKNLAQIRRAEPELQAGAFDWVDFTCETENPRALLFRRAGKILVAVSLDSRPLKITFSSPAGGKTLLAAENLTATTTDGQITLELPPYGWWAHKA